MKLAQLLITRRDEILRSWSEQARRSPAASDLTEEELIGCVPELLEQLAARLGASRPREGAAAEAEGLVDVHVCARIRQGFELHAVVSEFTWLGDAAARAWAGERGADFPEQEESEQLFAALNDAINDAVLTFARYLTDDEQAEKRWLRSLDRIASGALGEGPPINERLSEVAEVVRDALRADVATILLHDPATRTLRSAASAGLEEPERYETRLDSAAFVASVASRPEASILAEALADEVDVSDALRRAGIEALLAQRLWSRGRLLGVLLVGVRERRRFRGRERLRLRALTGRLSLILDNAQLFQEREEALRSLREEQEARERFVSTLAHDLRGPLTTARLHAETLRTHPERLAASPELALRMERALDRAEQMVRNLLDANRIRAGQRLPLQLAPCDLAAIAREIADELGAMHGNRIVVSGDAEVRGWWSAPELRRAIWNLAGNALKYGAPEAPIRIDVRQVDGRAEVAVHNDGEPIPPEEQAQIFEPFSRARSTEGSVGGWGLGLTLVRGSVESHGGTVHVESAAGRGTTFLLRLPLDARPQPTAPAAQPQEARG